MASVSQQALMGSYGGAALTSFTLFSETTSNAVTIAWPVSVQAGDVAVLFDESYTITLPSPTPVTPTDFSSILDLTANISFYKPQCNISWKILTGTEAGDITGLAVHSDVKKVLYIFRPNVPATSVTIGSLHAEQTGGDPAAQLCAASGGTSPLAVLGFATSSSSSANPVFTTASPAFTSEIATADGNGLAGYKIYEASPVDHTIDTADLGVGIGLFSFYLQIA